MDFAQITTKLGFSAMCVYIYIHIQYIDVPLNQFKQHRKK